MRRSILLAGALTTTLALAACGNGSGGDDTSGAGTGDTGAASTGDLTVWVDETRIDVFTELAAQFEEQTGATVDLVEKASADIRKDFVQQVPTGSGPDIVVGANDWTGEFVANGVAQPVELGDKADGFSPVAVSAFTYKGAVYGTPYAIENIALVRNDALVTETPATFDELVAQNATTGATFPVLVQAGDNGVGDPYHLYPLQTSFGAPVFTQNEDGSYTSELAMGGEAGEAFAAYLVKLGADGALDPAIDASKAKQAFLDGESPYMITGPWNTTEFTKAGMEISVLPVPSAGGQESSPFVGVQGAYISAKTDNKILANEFVVNFLGSTDVQVTLAKAGGRAPALTEAAAQVDDPVMTAFADAAGTTPQPNIPEMNSVWELWAAAEGQLFSGQASDPAATWAEMVTNIETKIATGK